ncbi:MAG: transglutaminase-like domain-containing protein [Burkholderiales bacterium]
MKPLILGAALAFWGWRSGNHAAAAALVLAAEAPHVLRARFEFRHADLARVADLCAALFVGLVIWLFASLEEPRTARAVLTSLLWLPAILMPVLLVQRFSGTGRIPLSALFRYLRKARERDPSIPDPPVDLGGVYFVICLLAAGIPNQRDHGFYAGIVLLVAWWLAAWRPRHTPLFSWLAVLLVAAGLGFATHLGLARLQAAIDDWVSDWFVAGMAADPYRSTTDLGSVGRLKLVDAIVLRVYASDEEAPRLRLLHRASFTSLSGTTWVARHAPMVPLEPEADGTTWQLAPGAPSSSARIVARLEGGKALLALPPGTLRVSALPAVALRRNALGAAQVELGGEWSPYVAESAGPIRDYAAPRAEDVALPESERAEFVRLAAELGLAGLPAGKALDRVREHFAGFAYSTYREAAVPAGTTALADFLRRSKSGHCEYFASATTLLLRAAGIPARYATGFVVQEYSRLEGAYVVRARHAHTWTRAYVAGRWLDLDTTPPSWFEAEEGLAPAWEGFADFLRWAGFRWSQRGTIEGGLAWYAAVALLVVLLAWRLARAKRVIPEHSARARRSFAGGDSEFYAVERALARRGLPRARSCAATASLSPGRSIRIAAWARSWHLPVR